MRLLKESILLGLFYSHCPLLGHAQFIIVDFASCQCTGWCSLSTVFLIHTFSTRDRRGIYDSSVTFIKHFASQNIQVDCLVDATNLDDLKQLFYRNYPHLLI